MYDEKQKITIEMVDKVIENFKSIIRPEGDNEGEAANAPEFYNNLSENDKKIVDITEDIIKKYIMNDDGSPNKRAITKMNKRGYSTSLYIGQYSENNELVGKLTIPTDNDDGKISLDLSNRI